MSISRAEFERAPHDWEGMKYAFGLCRACNSEVMVCTEWEDELGVVPYSTGTRALCDNVKCGDKFPAIITRMATPQDVAFENIRSAIATANSAGVDLNYCFDALTATENVHQFRAAINASIEIACISKGGAA